MKKYGLLYSGYVDFKLSNVSILNVNCEIYFKDNKNILIIDYTKDNKSVKALKHLINEKEVIISLKRFKNELGISGLKSKVLGEYKEEEIVKGIKAKLIEFLE